MARKAAIPTAIAALAFLAALTFAYLAGGGDDAPTGDPSPTAAAARPDDTATAVASTATVQATATPTEAPVDATAAGSSTDADPEETATASPSPQGTATPVQPQPTSSPTPTAPTSLIEGYTLRVPSLGVDAVMTDLGVDADGVMEVPVEAQLVGWYRFTSLPGQPGNTLLGGHITWHGATAVFRYLEAMSPGDTIYIDTPGGQTFEYVVRETWWAEPYTASDIRRVIGTRSGPETVTLFTCGGTWDSGDHEYSHRRVVTAVRVG